MKGFTPAQTLVVLVLFGLALGGLAQTLSWKRVATSEIAAKKELAIRQRERVQGLDEKILSLEAELAAKTGWPVEIAGVFTKEEELIVQLQDQIAALHNEIRALNKRIAEELEPIEPTETP